MINPLIQHTKPVLVSLVCLTAPSLPPAPTIASADSAVAPNVSSLLVMIPLSKHRNIPVLVEHQAVKCFAHQTASSRSNLKR